MRDHHISRQRHSTLSISQSDTCKLPQLRDRNLYNIHLLSCYRLHRQILSKGSPPTFFLSSSYRLHPLLYQAALSYCLHTAFHLPRHGKNHGQQPYLPRRNGAWICWHSLQKRLELFCRGVLNMKRKVLDRGQGRPLLATRGCTSSFRV